jgi:hypothetical protein
MIKKMVTMMLVMLLTVPLFTYAASAHWVDPELKSYKQRIVQYKDGSSMKGPITKEEWESFYFHVLSPDRFDKPIEIANWVTMIKMGVQLPKDKEDEMIKGYVYNLVPIYTMNLNRETTVGGLMKLLTASIVKGSWSNTEADASKVYVDFKDISDMQQGLVQIAYRDGLLDSATQTKFRPKDNLTNAEAISMMEKVMSKYEQVESQLTPPPKPGFPEVVTLFETTPMFSTPNKSLSPTGMIAPQDVQIVAVQNDWLNFNKVTDTKWFQVATWLGAQWVQLELLQVGNLEKTETFLLLQKVTTLQYTPYPGSELELALSPQKVHVVALLRSKFSNSYLVETWVGPKWITNPNGAIFEK